MKQFVSLFLLIFLVCLVGCNHKEIDERFEKCREQFCTVKDRSLALENGDYDFRIENQKVLAVFQFSNDNQKTIIDFSELEITCINIIRESISTDFSFIRVTDEAIFFGGIGSEIYVYSKNGKSPEYFLDVEDKRFKTYEIDLGWYRLLREGYYLFP